MQRITAVLGGSNGLLTAARFTCKPVLPFARSLLYANALPYE